MWLRRLSLVPILLGGAIVACTTALWAVLPCEEGTQAAGGCTLVGERFLVPVYAAGGGLFFLGGLGWIVGGLLIRLRGEPG